MKISELRRIVKGVLDEMSVSAGAGAYSTPFAFAKKGQGKNIATKTAEKLGYKAVKRPKHPSHTKMFDYLQERLGFITPNAFVSEKEMYESDSVKYMENIGMEVVNKPKHPSTKKIDNYSTKKTSTKKDK